MHRSKSRMPKKDPKRQCKESIRGCCKRVDRKKADIFGFMSTKDWKQMKIKRLAVNFGGFAVVLFLIKIFYDFQPNHFQMELPKESDLHMNPNLRSQNNIIEDYTVRDEVVTLLQIYCEKQTDFDILFCHNVQLNGVPIYSPCFMTCHNKQFYYNLEVIETDERKDIFCIEAYSTMNRKVKRNANALIRGEKGLNLQPFNRLPNSTLEACTFQHADDVSRGKWL